jgi:MOSC domain-containing protein YiiM
MTTARLLSVNVATPVAAHWAGDLGRTAIHKKPVVGPVRAEAMGLQGDQVADTRHHGGVDQAVYAFAREDLDLWASRLGGDIPNGGFGENLTTEGIDLNEALIGDRWRIGTATFEVASVRIPCNVFKGWLGASGYDAKGWLKRFTAEGRPGPYLRVVEPGQISAGDGLDVVGSPDHDVTVGLMFRALTTERSLLPKLLAAPALPAGARRQAERYAEQFGAAQEEVDHTPYGVLHGRSTGPRLR